MIIKKLITEDDALKNKLKNLVLYLYQRRVAKKAWDKRHQIVFDKHPEFRKRPGNDVLQKHREVWKPFRKYVNDDTLKICSSISGTSNPLIIPEEIFQTDIEPTLNSYPEAHYLAHKSFYNRWFKAGLFPKDLLHIVDGIYLDNGHDVISAGKVSEVIKTFRYPVVMKPNIETWGGKNVQFIKNPDELKLLIRQNKNVVVQERIEQHPELASYNRKSLNTVRVYLYRSVQDNQFHIINTVLRMGNGGIVDNVTAGGLVSRIRKNGRLHGYAVDMYGQKFMKHPVSRLDFDGIIPQFDELKELSKDIAQQLFLLRIIGLDLCLDKNSRWRAIEINTRSHSIRFSQYAGIPFFGPYTEEVIDYCKAHHWAAPPSKRTKV